jgi:L-lactate dehydrogenase (cytochrome)
MMKISTNASYSLLDIAQSAPKGTPLFFQLYVNKDRSKSAALLAQAEKLGVKAIFLTIDAPDTGKREADERVRSDQSFHVPMTGASISDSNKSSGVARTTGAFIDNGLTWEIVPWIRQYTKLPLVIKGVQSVHDARRAMEMGCEGIVVSNHGGRCLDT